MNHSLNSTACDVVMDEWGKCVVKEEDIMSIKTDDVLGGIRQNNPAITAVRVDLSDEHGCDWAAAGKSIGSSRYLRFLCLGIREVMTHEDVQAFFGGLALNRSVQALKIYIHYRGYDEQDSFIEEQFKALLPWFRFNDNIQVFDLKYTGNSILPSCIKDAILACPSLKSIRLYCNHADCGVITGSILAKREIQHLSLTGGFLSRDACSHIKSLLSDKRCVLRSLTLAFGEYPCLSSVNEIIDGLSNNQSLRCINLEFRGKIKSASYGFATSIIDSLREKKLGTIEKFQLQLSCHGPMIIRFPPLHGFGRQMPNVKSLTISDLEFDSVAQGTSTNHTVMTGLTSSLRELRMAKFNDQGLNELSSYILRDSSLRVLHLDRQRVSSGLLLSFFNGIQSAKYLESIKLDSVITNDAVMVSFCNWITATQSLKVLKVTCFENISSVGWQSFATALASLDNLEDIDMLSDRSYFISYTILNPDLDSILNAFIAKPSLKRVSLKLNTFAQLQVIANVLESPNCGITEVDITYQDTENTGLLELRRLTETLVSSLESNTSLRTSNGLPLCHWPSVSNLLCDTSSIDATIQSNHTLEHIYITLSPFSATKCPLISTAYCI